MSRTVLRFNNAEMACLYSSVYNELCGLEEELDSGDIAPEDVANVQRSVDMCKTVLAKIVAAAPNASYNLPD